MTWLDWFRSWARPSRADDASGTILFSAQDYWYHNRAHSDVQLARALSADRTVLLVNSLGMRMPRRATTSQPVRRILRKIRSTLRGVRQPEKANPRLYVLSPLSVPAFAHPWQRKWNARLVRLQVRAAGRLLRLGTPDVIVTLPTAWEVARELRARSFVINRSDRYSSLPEADTELIAGMERDMLARCDAAVYVSDELLREEQPLVDAGHGYSVCLGHGVDLDHFSRDPESPDPADLAAIPHPRVGFFGGLDDYVVDLSLIKRLALELSPVSVVLVGDATCPMEELTALANVHWLGMKSYDEIPAYGSGFDVAIMPWLQNDWIRFCNPIKTKEYLSLGLPVVSTYYPAAESHCDVMAISRSDDEFVRLVKEAIEGNSVGDADTRRRSVLGDSWAARADSLREILEGRRGA